MDFRNEVQVGTHTYGVSGADEPTTGGERSRIAVEFTGARLDDGRVVAEGNLVVAADALVDSSLFLTRTLDGIAALQGQAPPGRQARSVQRPPNAGQPWTPELDHALRTRWINGGDGTASALVGEMSGEMGRSRSSVRARLARVGCDPQTPGRLLNSAADP